MFKFVKIETGVATEAALNKLTEDKNWQVVGTGPDYVILSDSPRYSRKIARVEDEGDERVSISAFRLRQMSCEAADLIARNQELQQQLEQQCDPDSIKHWDSMRKERDALLEVSRDLFEALFWASGAKDFAPGDGVTPAGEAREGWVRGPARALESFRALEENLRKAHREI